MENINKPIKINTLELKNRLVFPPMATSKSDDGWVNDQLVAYYDEKSRGGHIGLIITEHAYISMDGKASENQISISRDEDILGLSKIVDAVHKNGSKIFAQINHAGNAATKDVTGCDVVSASALEMEVMGRKRELSKEFTKEDLKKLVENFVMQVYVPKKQVMMESKYIQLIFIYSINSTHPYPIKEQINMVVN